jgi:hypothetical protein
VLLNSSFLLDVPPEPSGASGIAIGVMLIVIVLLVGLLLAGFVALLVWRKRAQTKADVHLPLQPALGQPSSPNQL